MIDSRAGRAIGNNINVPIWVRGLFYGSTVLFFILFLTYAGKAFFNLLNYRESISALDLKQRWVDQKYFLDRQNPYDVLFNVTGQSSPHRSVRLLEAVGKPFHGGLPPWAFTLLLPIVWSGSIVTAHLWHGFLSFLAFFAIGWQVNKIGHPFNLRSRVWLIGAVLAVSSFASCVSGGQFTLHLFALNLATILLANANYQVWAGVLLGFSMIKPQVSFLFFLPFLFRSQFRVVAAGVATVVLASLTTWVICRTNPILMTQQMLQATRAYSQCSYSIINWLNVAGIPYSTALVLTGVLFLTLAVICSWSFRGADLLEQFALLACIERLMTYHTFYDNSLMAYLLLILGLKVLHRGSLGICVWFSIIGATLWIPPSISTPQNLMIVNGLQFTTSNDAPVPHTQIAIWLVSLLVGVISLRQTLLDKKRSLPPS